MMMMMMMMDDDDDDDGGDDDDDGGDDDDDHEQDALRFTLFDRALLGETAKSDLPRYVTCKDSSSNLLCPASYSQPHGVAE